MEPKNIKPKILVIVGPTSSGKSDLAVELALKYNGEVVSADSRQVYKGMDIGTGKITKEEMKGVPHHLLDVISPSNEYVFSVQDFKVLADKAIADILSRNKLPIICGGTGFYIQAVVDNVTLPEVSPDQVLRAKLSEKSTEELFEMLKAKDPERAEVIDPHNHVRIIRALEINEALGNVPKIQTEPLYDTLQIGIEISDEELRPRIFKRLLKRFDLGMLDEAKKLHAEGVTFKRMEDLGLEYKYMALHLQNKLTQQEMIDALEIATRQYARRQKTWFRRDKRIKWLSLDNKSEIACSIDQFIVS
ncbi:MAG: tRNA (adenosine(37)-N6)-dimethylallyltransferase MiaA [Patescibacteria group bacterium]